MRGINQTERPQAAILVAQGLRQWTTKMAPSASVTVSFSALGFLEGLSRFGHIAVLRWSFLFQDAHKLSHPGRVIGPGPGGNHRTIYHGFGIDERPAGSFHVRFQSRICCCSSAFEYTCCG